MRSTAGTLNINAASPLTDGATPGKKTRSDVSDKDVGEERPEREAGAAKRFYVSLSSLRISKPNDGPMVVRRTLGAHNSLVLSNKPQIA